MNSDKLFSSRSKSEPKDIYLMSEPQKIAFHNLFLELSKGLLSVDSVNVLVGYLWLITTDSYQNMTGSQYDDNSQS